MLIIQSAGNLLTSGSTPNLGIKDHLAAGRDYPTYLYEASSRIANPGQSLQALTVGSIAYGLLEDGEWRSFATEPDQPSSFSRSGPGIWNIIKLRGSRVWRRRYSDPQRPDGCTVRRADPRSVATGTRPLDYVPTGNFVCHLILRDENRNLSLLPPKWPG